MREIALHLLDIVENAVKASASVVKIELVENDETIIFIVEDNGEGMKDEVLKKVTDPFVTSRSTRRVGLGIPLLKHTCEMTGGNVQITSNVGVGTKVQAVFIKHHIDCLPLGDLSATIYSIVMGNENIDFIYSRNRDNKLFTIDFSEMKKTLNGVSFHSPEVSMWINEYIKECERNL